MMREPPPLVTCFRYPVTTGVAALAIVATLRWWSGADIERFMFDDESWWQEPWQLLAPVLFHSDLIHLLFNLYWLLAFGSLVEQAFGSSRTLGVYVFLAVGSGMAEVAVFDGGVGLSGVGYGLFGLLWILGRNDRRFQDAVDRRTVQLFVGWFFLCIALTVAGVWNIANVAHGAGWVLGMLLGWAITARDGARRLQRGAVLAAAFALCMIGGTVARPYTNWSADYATRLACRGYEALETGKPDLAAFFFQRAVAIVPKSHDWWHNLGVAYHRLGQRQEAKAAFARAAAMVGG